MVSLNPRTRYQRLNTDDVPLQTDLSFSHTKAYSPSPSTPTIPEIREDLVDDDDNNSHHDDKYDEEDSKPRPFPKVPIIAYEAAAYQRAEEQAAGPRSLRAMLFASALMNVLFCVMVGSVVVYGMPMGRWSSQSLYSPAQEVLDHRITRFESDADSPYRGVPGALNNELWADLYAAAPVRITADEARQLQNRTLPIPGDTGYYVASLSVFHQLYCLDLVRQAVYAGSKQMMANVTVDACIDDLRQSIQCSSDITPTVWSREIDGVARESTHGSLHSCRDFDAIRRWASGRRLGSDFDSVTVVHDDPLGWEG